MFDHTTISGNELREEHGKILDSSINQGLNAFNPDMMYEQLAKDYSMAEKVYGETMLQAVTGDEADVIERNLRFPEYKRELKSKLRKKAEELKKEGLLDRDFNITEKGFEVAALTLYLEELDKLEAKGLGEKRNKDKSHYGEPSAVKNFKKHDRYKDISVRSTVRQGIRRGHTSLQVEDLKVYERTSRGKIHVIYALDASGSMKGEKISVCKKAGVALAFKAIHEHDKVGLLVFGSSIEDCVLPTSDFSVFLKAITRIKAKKQTDIALTISKAIDMFPLENITKHLVLISDIMPTVGTDPSQNTLDLVSKAKDLGITISVVGIGIDDGLELAKRIVELGNGRLYIIKDLEKLDTVVLEDYYAI